MTRYQIVVTGRVQGVGYRAFVERQAISMQLGGYVKNQYDGSVLIEAEGPVEKLDLFIIKCKEGPGWAHVSKVTVVQLPLQGDTTFRISR